MSSFTQTLYHLDTALELVLLALLICGPFRKRILFSTYIAATALLDVIESAAYYRLGWRSPAYRTLYWTDRVALDLLLFLLVIVLTFEALRESPMRGKASKTIGGIVSVALLLPFALLRYHHGRVHGYFDSQWFNHASQIWNFGAAIMNLVLWAALLASRRRRDPQLVTLSIGLGILTSSAAIAWGARQWLSEQNRWPVDIFAAMAHIAAFALWCWLFRPKTARRAPPQNAAPPDALTTPS